MIRSSISLGVTAAVCFSALLSACGGGDEATSLPAQAQAQVAGSSLALALAVPVGDPRVSAVLPETGIVGPFEMNGCQTSDASVRYVNAAATAGGDGSLQRPFRTLQQALQTPQLKVVCMAGGTYVGSADVSERSLAIIGGFDSSFRARGPLRTPTVLRPATADGTTLTGSGFLDLELDGLELTGAGCTALRVHTWTTGSRIVMRNMHVHHNIRSAGCSASQGGFDIVGSPSLNVEVSHSVIEYNDGLNFGGGGSIGVYDGGNPTQRGSANDGFGQLTGIGSSHIWVHDSIVRGNRVTEVGSPHGAGLALWANSVVEHNEFRDNDTWAGGTSGQGVGGGLIVIYSDASHGAALTRIDSNWFEGNRAGNHGSAVMIDGNVAALVTRNVVLRNRGQGALLLDSDCNSSACGDETRAFMTVAGNTVAFNEGAGVQVQNGTLHLQANVFWRNASATGDVASNPIAATPANIVRGTGNVLHLGAGAAWPLLQDSVDGEGMSDLLSSRSGRLLTDMVANRSLRSSSGSFTPAFAVGGFMNPVPGGAAAEVYGAKSVPLADVLGSTAPGFLWGAYSGLGR